MSFSSASSSKEEASEADDQLEDASVTSALSQRSQRYHLRTLSSPYRSAAGATAVAGHRRSAAPRQPAAAAGQATAPRPTSTAAVTTQAAASARLASLRRIAADAIPVSAQARRLRESQDRNIGGDPSSRGGGGGGGGGIEAAAASATDDSGPHCTICFDSLNDNSSPVRALLCGHAFHRACILKAWSFVRPTLPKCCPVCRQICFAAAEVDNTPDVQILDSAR